MIPTAREFLLNEYETEFDRICAEPAHIEFCMQEFAKLHVKAALEAAKQQVENYNGPNCYDHTPYYGPCVTCGSYDNYELIRDPEGLKDSILTIYPESNII